MTGLIDTISLVGSLSSISGLSLKDIFRDRHASISRIRPLLARLEQASDKFIGYWLVREWNTTSAHLLGYHVSGGMAIYHRYPKAPCWEGEIVFTFEKGPGAREPQSYKPFIARYRVVF